MRYKVLDHIAGYFVFNKNFIQITCCTIIWSKYIISKVDTFWFIGTIYRAPDL